jgi:hypothetical protein
MCDWRLLILQYCGARKYLSYTFRCLETLNLDYEALTRVLLENARATKFSIYNGVSLTENLI